VRKKIVEKIYFLFLLIAPLVFSSVVVYDLLLKEEVSFVDSELEVSEENNFTDTSQTHFEQVNDSSINNHCGFQFSFFKSSFNHTFTHPREYVIYLGLSTPPPEYL